jgi:hypothetical protein
LTYEEAKNIVETLDENLIIPKRIEYHQLSEDLAWVREDIKVIQDQRKGLNGEI